MAAGGKPDPKSCPELFPRVIAEAESALPPLLLVVVEYGVGIALEPKAVDGQGLAGMRERHDHSLPTAAAGDCQ